MADTVVDRLEVVEVEHHQRQLAVVALRAGDLLREQLVEAAPVAEAGERVDVRRLPQFVARALKPDLAPDHHRLEQKYENADEARRKKIDDAMAVDISEHFVP